MGSLAGKISVLGELNFQYLASECIDNFGHNTNVIVSGSSFRIFVQGDKEVINWKTIFLGNAPLPLS